MSSLLCIHIVSFLPDLKVSEGWISRECWKIKLKTEFKNIYIACLLRLFCVDFLSLFKKKRPPFISEGLITQYLYFRNYTGSPTFVSKFSAIILSDFKVGRNFTTLYIKLGNHHPKQSYKNIPSRKI